MSKESNKINDDIKKRMETIIWVLLNQPKIQEKTIVEKILLLSSQGYDNQEIASMLGTTYSMVAKEKSKGRKRKKDE